MAWGQVHLNQGQYDQALTNFQTWLFVVRIIGASLGLTLPEYANAVCFG